MDFSSKREKKRAGNSQKEEHRQNLVYMTFVHHVVQKKTGLTLLCAFIFSVILVVVPCLLPSFAYAASTPGTTPTATGEKKVTVNLQAYAYPDNSDGEQVTSNTAVIAYPKSAGFPTLHEQATEGVGTIDDPITFAAYEPLTQGDQAVFPPGEKIYVESLRKYFILEDTCGDCGQSPQGTTYIVRLWLGPSQLAANDQAQTIEDCVKKVAQATASVVLNPSSTYPVEKTPLYSGGACTAKTFTDQTSNPGGDTTPTVEPPQDGSPTAESQETPTAVPPQEWTPPTDPQGTPTVQPTWDGSPTAHPRRKRTTHPHKTPTAQPTQEGSPTAQPTQEGSPTVQPGSPTTTSQQGPGGDGKSINVAVTSFGFPDNDDGSGHFGTAVIAFPKSGGYPTLHNQATEGTGTYNDPITFAADVNVTIGQNPAFPPGTRIYVPFLRKYFILEDQCAGCDNVKNGNAYHIDLWLGPSQPGSQDTAQSIEACEGTITHDTEQIIMSPTATHPVDTTPLYKNGVCSAKQY